jgi:adenosylhomocysteine nucleosidase
MIAILVAVNQESQPILRRMETTQIVRLEHLDFHEGMLAGQPVVLLALGVGRECAHFAAEITVRSYRPDLIISAGFGGGLTDALATGDIVVGTEILDLTSDDGYRVQWNTTAVRRVPPTFTAPGKGRLHYGKIITAPEILHKAADKRRLGQTTGALAVDMETSAVAAVAATTGTDFLAVRCISDTNRDNLPAQFNDFFVMGQLKRRRVLSACVRDVRVLTDLAWVGHRAHRAGRNLALFLETALRTIELPTLPLTNA